MASIARRRTSKGEPRYDVRYRTPDHAVRTRTFRTRRDADRFAATVEADKLRGTWVDPRDAGASFADVADRWLATNPAKRPSARARDDSILNVHLKPAIGDRSIGSITPNDVRGLVVGWGQRLAPRTVRRNYGVLRAVVNFAIEADLILRSPCRGVKLPAVTEIEPRIVTAGELASLAEAVGEYAPMVYLGALLGLRWGECAGLRVGRVDFFRATVTVAEQLSRGPQGLSVFGPPKSSAGRRTLTVPVALLEMLSVHCAARGLDGSDAEALLFASETGRPLDYTNFRRRVWLPGCKASKLVGLQFHDLRRANATAMVLDGVDVKTAQARLGHSDPRLTLATYAQATTEGDRAAADRLAERFLAPPRDVRAIGVPTTQGRGGIHPR